MSISKKDIEFLKLIDSIEPKAKCLRANVACALVKSGKLLVKTTNDWHKEANCSEIGCVRNRFKVESGTRREICTGMCAEQWALVLCAKRGIKVSGATCYVTKHPCRVCESLLTEAGIKRVVYQEGYPDILPNFNLFIQRGVTVEQGPDTVKKSPNIPTAPTI